MRILIAAFLLLAASAQDEAKIRELIRSLDSDSFEVREQAQKELVRIGDAALPFLKQALAEASKGGGELKLRVEAALREIELAGEALRVCPDPKRITLKAERGDLAQALGEIARQAGIKVDASAADGADPVTLDLKDAPILLALDRIFAGQRERTYEWRDEGAVRVLRERHAPLPAAYDGAFRVRVSKMRLERSTDFKSKTASIFLTLDADCEKSLKLSRKRDIELTRAVDDKGAALEVKPGESTDDMNRVMQAGGRVIFRVAGGALLGGAEQEDHDFTLKGLSEGASRVTLAGKARFHFPLGLSELRLARNETRDNGDYTIRLSGAAGTSATVVFKSRRGNADDRAVAEEVAQRLDAASPVAVDEDGAEHKGDGFIASGAGLRGAVVVLGGGGGGRLEPESQGVTYQAIFPTLRNKALKEIRFRFAARTYTREVPFALEGIALP